MSSRDLTIAGYLFLALLGLVLQIRSYSPSSKIPSLGTVSSRVMRTKTGRIGVIAGWAWLGLHFFAR